VFFVTRVGASNGQWIKSAQASECYMSGFPGGAAIRQIHPANPSAFTVSRMGGGLAGDARAYPLAGVSVVINTASMNLAAGTRTTLAIACQYQVTVQGTRPSNSVEVNPGSATRRRLLQVATQVPAGSSSSTNFVNGQFSIESGTTSSTSSSSAMSVSPTVAAACVLAVAAAVLVVVAVRRQNQRKAAESKTKESNQEMVNLPALTGSSTNNLHSQA